jgi:hypothetical protein
LTFGTTPDVTMASRLVEGVWGRFADAESLNSSSSIASLAAGRRRCAQVDERDMAQARLVNA